MGRQTLQGAHTGDPSLPLYSIPEAAAKFTAEGVPMTQNTLRTAIYKGQLRRHLISNRVRLSENDIRSWIASTADAEFVPRHVRGQAS